MRVAFALGGTDWGRSGLGTYVRCVLPHLARQLEEDGGQLIPLGNRRELDAYSEVVGGMTTAVAPAIFDRPALAAPWYLFGSAGTARGAGADVVLCASAARRFSWMGGMPTVAVVHDLAQLAVPEKYDALRVAWFKHVTLRALKSATELVAISGATRDDLAKALDVDAARIRIVLNGVDAARFAPAGEGDARVEKARSELGIEGQYLLFPARLEHPGKNHVRLLEAFARASACEGHALLLSGGDWGAKELIETTAREHGIADRVRLLGYVDEDVLPGLVVGADAVVQVGLHEGFGLPALEGLAAGRPVVASSTGALPEVVGPLGAQCDPFDVDSIASALERVVRDEELRRRSADEGPAWAEARGWKNTAAGLLDGCRAACGSAS